MAEWLKTVKERGDLAQVTVYTLDTVYRRNRDRAKRIAEQYPALAVEMDKLREDLLRLYQDAHAHTPADVPLSHAAFVRAEKARAPK